jgi:amino acid adenylation domain-containing protein
MPPGRPIANATIYVLDAAGEPVPVGVTGELYLGGAGVTRGYRRLPGHTAERYLPDPFGRTPGARLYRTGDLGRWLPDGTIEFMGRGDAQVKVRGFRVELGEIEARLAAHAAIHEVVVVARDGEIGDPRLVAYYTGDAASAAELRALLAERLPDYMIPAAFVHMDVLPVNPNGKLDRKALPEPEFAPSEENYVAPRTPVEEVVAGIWAEVLGVERLGVEESFFELGGHSLLATRAVSRVREVFGVELPLRAFFEGPTVAEVAERVEEMRRAGLPVLPPVVPAGRTGALPLSFTQQRLWFLEQLGSPGSVYHLHKSLRLRGPLDVDALARALDGVVARHEALRTTFAQVDGVPEQRIAPAAASGFPLVQHDLEGRADAEAELDRLTAEEAHAPFDLERGPLVRGRLIRLAADDHVLLLAMHHLVTDGWSFGVLFDEIAAFYAAHREGRDAQLAALPVQYADYAVWQRRWVEGEVLREQADYWTRTLAGAPELLELPTDRPRPAQVDHGGALLGVELDEALTAGLKALARRHGTTLYMTLLAGWAVVLGRLSGQDDVVIGTPTAGRGRRETEGLIGCFVNTLALRLELSGAPTVAELLDRVKERALAAQHHQDIPFEQVVELVEPVRSRSHHPLFQVVIAWQNLARGDGTTLSLPGLEPGAAVESAHVDAKVDLWLGVWEANDRILGNVKYATALFDPVTVERHLAYLRRVLGAMAADDLQGVDALPLLPEAERRLVLQTWNRTEAPHPRGLCIHQLFEEQVRRTPDAAALIAGDLSLTYAELNARANRLARRLAALGAGPERIVALALDRSAEMVVALLAVNKAGAAFLAVDPAYPAERRRWMLERSDTPLVLTTSVLAADLPATGATVVALDLIALEIEAEDDGDLAVEVDAENAAYVIFTSGSTGRPKGVVVPHRGVGNLAAAQREAFGVPPDGRVLQFASFSFDAAVAEVAHTLLGGAALVMARPGQAGPELLALLRDQAVTVATLPPSLLATLPAEGLPALRTIVSAGEAVSADVVARWGQGRRFVNAYGPTEATVCATVAIDPSAGGRPAIGGPIANVRAYVLDARMEPVPVGVPGELYVGGVGVARGYLGQPGQTAERFVPDPFGEPGARLYRTGDRGRWLPGGSIEFLGRNDFQVKLRGFRVELGEIEAQLLEHPGVREAVVVAREEGAGDSRLVAYWAGEERVDVEALRAHLGERLPEHMVPAAYVHLSALPLTPNGKVNREALPSPEGDAYARGGYEAPVGALEQALAAVWSDLLGVERVSRWDDFFELGGHSLLALQMASHIQQVLDLEVEPARLFECPVLKDLAEMLGGAARAELPPVERVDRGGRLPLSFAQQRLWFLEQMGGLGSAYHASQQLRLRGALDRAALRRALDGIVARHEALRTTFPEVDGAPEQRIGPAEAGFPLVELDFEGRPDAELQRLMAEEARAPFDLRRGPLVRGRLVRLADDDHVLLLTMHHIVTDGWSMGVFFGELSALYAAHREGGDARLAPLPVQYADYAAWQRRWVEGDVLREQAEYWTQTLAGAPRLLELPADHPRPAEMDHAGAVLPLELDAELTAGLKALSRRHETTLYMTLLAAWAAVLGRLSGQDDLVIGTPTAGRGRQETEGLIGFFVNTLALRVDLSGAPTVAQLLERVRDRAVEAQAHQDIPFEQVVELVQPERSLSYSPLFQVMLDWRNAPRGSLTLPGLELERAGVERGTAKFDLSLSLEESDGRIAGTLTYATSLFERATVERWVGYLRRVLGEMAAGDARGVERLALMPESERALVVEGWNRTDEPFTDLVLIHHHFEAQAARAPGAIALEFGGESLTYAELDARANRLAHRLVELGVRPEGRVALCMEPCSAAIIGLLGVMKAGAAYVPLDPAAPDERTAFMLAESGARIVLADAASAARPWAAGYHVLVAGGDLDAELERHPATAPAVQVGPRHLAYVLYTSGSTGLPKGVLVEHGGVCNTIATFSRLYENGPESRVLLFAPLHFDASVLDVFTALANGGTLIVAPREETIPGDELTSLMARKRVTHAKFTPSALAATPWADLPELEVVILGGEICSAELVARWAPGRRFFNGWGPTEVSVRSTAFQATDGTRPPPIGRPLGNVTHYVLDPAGRPVPIGVPGEIYVGGAGVTRGYLGRPALTAERYVPDPFAKHPGARMYRTGDKVRWRADGMLDFVARMDGQVKVRGFRIELGEIEAVLRRHDDVADCGVMVREDVPGDQRLVAYVVGDAAVEELREHVRRSLPEYMVPAAFVFLDALPLSPNGKLDRKALPAPEYGAAEDAYVAPRTPTEEVLAGIWAEVLGVKRVGAEDQFFELGGHSLVATRVAARVRGVFGVDLPLRAVFERSVLSELAAEIDRLRGTGASAGEGAIAPAEREGDLPVTFAQERLWFVDALDPGSPVYAIPFSYGITGRLHENALRRALAELVRRHEPLRTTLPAVDGVPVQRIAPAPADFDLPVADLRHLPRSERRAEADRLAAEAKRHRFDLARGPLFRASLVRVADDEHRLLLNVHHAIGDGWSLGVLREELSALYGAFSRGEPSPLPEPALQYADYAAWQRERLRGEVLERQVGYWKERLEGAPALLELPTDRPRPPVESHRGAVERLVVPSALAAEVNALARREGATLFMVLLAALDVVLGRLAGQEDVVVGTPIAGRTRAETDRMVGLFLNSLALRTDLSGDPSFRELLGRVRETTLDAYAHQELPFERVLEEVRPERSMAHAPVFQVMLNLANFQRGAFGGEGLEVAEAEAGSLGEVASKFDLTLYVRERDGGIHVALVYAADLFDAPRMRGLLAQFEGVLRQAAAAPETRVGALSLATEAARGILPDPARPIQAEPWRGAVHETFAVHAAKSPDAPAVSDPSRTWTYAELDAAANRIAHRLIDGGVRPGDVVAVYAHRSAALVRALLGAWKAGAAFAILDPAYPPARLAAQVGASRPAALLRISAAGEVPAEVAAALTATARTTVVLMAEGDDGLGGFPSAAPKVSVAADDLAYVAFTSGTTGTPKAIAGTHRPLAHFFGWYATEFGIGAADRVSLLAGLAHDPLLRDVFAALAVGARIAIPDPDQVGTPGWLAGWMGDEGITVAHLTPAMAQVLATGPGDARLPALRLACFGGDVLRAADVARLRALAPNAEAVNFYGATETPQAMGFFRIPGDVAAVGPAVPVGRGIEGVDLLVVTPSGTLAGIGERGEIAVRTPYLSRGYLNDAELTAARFIPNPLTGDPADRVYRTGDLGRYRLDGAVEPAGRVDGQVKVRGFRVELGEIEAALAKHPAVAEAVVAARGTDPHRALVAYAVPREGAGIEAQALRAHLKSILPDYMVPAAFVAIAAVPLTANGKVDRRALPEPEAVAAADSRPAAPRTPTEEILAEVWAEVLRLESVGVNDDFFALGGHSLLATRLLARVQNALGVVVPLRALFEGPTVAELAGRVEDVRQGGARALPPVVRVDRDRPLPLSFAQERLWFIDRLEGGSAPYNIPAALRLAGALDTAALERSLGEIVRRHESLRTIFREVDGGAVQVIAPFTGFALPIDDLSALPEADREAEVRRRAREDAARPFDLAEGPLVRAVLLRLAGEEHVLLLCIHHIVSDGWSSGVLRRELSALYTAYRDGGDSPLAEPPVQYADFAVWQREQLAGEVLDRQVGYWKERLAGAPALLELPTDRPRPAVQSHRGARETFDLPRALLDGLQALGRGEGATLYMVMLSAFQLLLSKYSGSEDVVVGSPIAGRTRREVEELIGFFANTLVLRTDLSADPTFRELLGRVREGTLGAYEHQDVPFERLVAELRPERSLSHSPLFQVMFALQNADRSGFDVTGLRMEGVGAEVETTRFDLGLTAIPHDGGVRGMLEYSTDLFDRSTVRRMLGHLERVLEQVAADADVRLSRVELLSAEERGLVVDAWNRTERETVDPPAHVLFAEWARRAPEAVALLAGGEAVTYGALDRRAAVLARHLRDLGVGPETPVGLCMERTPELLVGVLGIWKAGGAYVPLDPGYPAERLGWIIGDAALPVVVATGDTAGVLPEHGATVVRVDALPEAEAAPEVPASDAGLAYVIYTSGSTGRPKGVLVQHGSLANLLASTRAAFGIREGDVMPALASYAFDIWLFEALLPLTSGATVRLVDRERVLDVEALAEEIADATLVHAVPALMRQLVHAERETPRLARLRRAFVGGDRVAADLLAEMREVLSGAESHVLYGPTEGTILASTHPVPVDGIVAGNPIGRPLGNVRLYVCDAFGGPQPAGVPGELLIGGAGVARGYLGRPAMTAERFVPDPFSAQGGARLYRTGDRARWREESAEVGSGSADSRTNALTHSRTGVLEFLGRTDFQVKVRGFRIEPGEIEAVLREHEGVRECAVLVREDAGENRLVAYVAGAAEADDLREHLRRSLPEYMVPAAFVLLDALPLTPNGKLDRKALPAPELAPAEDRYVAPRTPTEEVLAEIWAEVLGLDRVGVEESFFDLGGHSLLATRVVSRVRKRFGVELPLRALFEHPTVGELARVVAESEAVAQAGPVPEPVPGPEASPHHLLEMIDELSEEELDRLLSAQL